MRKTLAIDFDGTICKYQPFKDGIIWQEPNEGAKEVLTKLHDNGWKLIVHTCRAKKSFENWAASIAEIEAWLNKHGIPFDDITDEKPIATAYIDDRGLRFTSWQDIKNYFI